MAKLDFPGSPSTNQKYPSPAVAGQPVYTWDGEKWTSIASQYVPGTAPFEPAMAYSGMQINGGMEVSQENGATPVSIVISTGRHILDGLLCFNFGGTTAITGAQVTDAPPGFNNSIKLSVTTAKVSLAATEEVGLSQSIEGYRVARLAWGTASAQPVSIGFWCKTHRTGMYSAAVTNLAYNRSYAFTWTQSAVDTWEYKTITIPGDTTGVWPKDNTAGLTINYLMGGGTDVVTTPGVWTAAGKDGATGTTNGVAATSDTFQITGVTVLPGTQAPTAAQSPNIMRPYGEELATCQRLYTKLKQVLTRPVAIGTNLRWIPSRVTMRTTPTTSLTAIVYSGGAGSGGTQQSTVDGTELTFAVSSISDFIFADVVFDARL